MKRPPIFEINGIKYEHDLEDFGNIKYLNLKHGYTEHKFKILSEENNGDYLIDQFGFGSRTFNNIEELYGRNYSKFYDDNDNFKIDILSKVTEEKGIFSEDWYIVMICYYYHLTECNLSNEAKVRKKLDGKPPWHLIYMGIEMAALYRDYYWKFHHEKAAQEGHRAQAGRKTGQKLASQARLKAGKKRTQAIVRAVKDLYSSDKKLMRNDSATARRIEAKHLPELKNGKNGFLGYEAILKHIQKARNENLL